MSLGIAVHVVAGILFVGVGTPDAPESILRPAAVEARDTLLEPGVVLRLDSIAGVGVTVAIAPNIHLDDPNDSTEGRQHSDRSPRDASDSPPAKAGTARKGFSGAMLWTLEFLVGGLVNAGER